MSKKLMFFFSSLFFGSFLASACKKSLEKKEIKSDWTFIVYIAADNDLDYFARRNIEQMKKIGSNKNITLVAQLDRYGAHEHTKRLLIEKNIIYQVNADNITGQQKLNSGNAQTLIDCCKWAITDFPANHYALILWNHGIGILDSIRGKSTNASELFVFNPHNHMLELNRSISFFEYLEQDPEIKEDSRGVCFSDTYGSYLTNEKLDYALKEIQETILDGKKLDIIGFDACLMAMVEVGNLLAPYADYMVASEEVELGTGWPYDTILKIFNSKTLSPEKFAAHIANKYKEAYESITKDFTQSAIILKEVEPLAQNIDTVSKMLLMLLSQEQSSSVEKAIKASRSRKTCTYFAEPSYIDLHHFYTNLLTSIDRMAVHKNAQKLLPDLKKELSEGLLLIKKAVLKNCTGESLELAKGLSIYFPYRYIDPSYKKTLFAKKTHWMDLLMFLI